MRNHWYTIMKIKDSPFVSYKRVIANYVIIFYNYKFFQEQIGFYPYEGSTLFRRASFDCSVRASSNFNYEAVGNPVILDMDHPCINKIAEYFDELYERYLELYPLYDYSNNYWMYEMVLYDDDILNFVADELNDLPTNLQDDILNEIEKLFWIRDSVQILSDILRHTYHFRDNKKDFVRALLHNFYNFREYIFMSNREAICTMIQYAIAQVTGKIYYVICKDSSSVRIMDELWATGITCNYLYADHILTDEFVDKIVKRIDDTFIIRNC